MFDLSDQQKETRAWAREFAEREVLPRAAEMDRSATYDRAVIEAMFEAGIMGMLVPEQHGGRDLSVLEYATVVEELEKLGRPAVPRNPPGKRHLPGNFKS